MRAKLLFNIAEVVLHRPYVMLALVASITLGCIAYSSSLPYSSSRIDLIPPDHPARIQFLEVVKEFGPQNSIVVVVEGGGQDRRRQFIETSSGRLKSDPEFRGTILDRIDLQPMRSRGPYYLERDQLTTMFADIQENEPFLDALPDLGMALRAMNRRLEATRNLGYNALEKIIPNCEKIGLLFKNMNQQLGGKTLDRKSWESFLGVGPISALELFDEAGFLASRDGSTHFVFLTPDRQSEELDYLVPLVARIRGHLSAAESPGSPVQWSLTGIPISVLDEFESTEKDLPRSTAAAILANILILLIGLRHRPLLALIAMLSLGAGIAWTRAFAKLTVGYLNLVSSVFILFLLGMGINYGIYFATRFDVERRRGLDLQTVMRKVFREQGRGILTSALAGSLAFFTLCLSPFKGFQELGLIAGTGLILCLVAGTLLMPPLILLIGKRVETSYPVERHIFRRIVRAVESHPYRLVALFTALTLYTASIGDLFPFDYDLNRMLPRGAESLVAGEKLRAARTLSPLSAIVVCDDLEELYRKDKYLRARSDVGLTLSWATFVPAGLDQKQKLLADLRHHLRRNLAVEETAENQDERQIGRQLDELETSLANSLELFRALQFAREAQAAEQAHDEVTSFRETLARLPKTGRSTQLSILGTQLHNSWQDLATEVEEWAQIKPPSDDLVPEGLRRRLRSEGGRYALIVSPAADINQKQAFERFHAAVSEVDQDPTGYPVIIHTMIGLLPQVLQEVMVEALLLIAALLILDLRNVRRLLLTLFPVVVGSIWLMGLMKLMGLKYNPVNFLALPMILGIGIENGVNFVHGFRDEDSAEALETQGRGMLLSAGTSIVGFQALALVSHRGLASFGLLLTLGTLTCLVASLFFLPAVVEIESRRAQIFSWLRNLMGHRFY